MAGRRTGRLLAARAGATSSRTNRAPVVLIRRQFQFHSTRLPSRGWLRMDDVTSTASRERWWVGVRPCCRPAWLRPCPKPRGRRRRQAGNLPDRSLPAGAHSDTNAGGRCAASSIYPVQPPRVHPCRASVQSPGSWMRLFVPFSEPARALHAMRFDAVVVAAVA